ARMFRKSTGQTPHQFVLRQRMERAKAMLRTPDARVLDVAVACGFKTQQHFAHVFRDVCRVSPTEYRQDFPGSEATCASETRSTHTPCLQFLAAQRLKDKGLQQPQSTSVAGHDTALPQRLCERGGKSDWRPPAGVVR